MDQSCQSMLQKHRSKTRHGLPVKNDQKDVPACKAQVQRLYVCVCVRACVCVRVCVCVCICVCGACLYDNSYIESEDEQVLLVITVDSNLTFKSHINNICK